MVHREPATVAEIVDAVYRGRIGHDKAMRALGLDTYGELVDTMHANGLPLWAHRPTSRPSPEIMRILAQACQRPSELPHRDSE